MGLLALGRDYRCFALFRVITSKKEVVFSSHLSNGCVAVCLFAQLCRNDWTDFNKTRWENEGEAKEELIKCVADAHKGADSDILI